MKSANKDMMDSLFFWGLAKRYQYGMAVAATDWNSVSEKKKRVIEKAGFIIGENICIDGGNVLDFRALVRIIYCVLGCHRGYLGWKSVFISG